MKVENKSTAIQLDAYLRQVRQNYAAFDQQHPSKWTSQSDTVNLSDRAREVQQAAQVLKQMPDIRQGKVQQIKLAVENGTYKVVGAQVASQMLRDTFENNMILRSIDQHV